MPSVFMYHVSHPYEEMYAAVYCWLFHDRFVNSNYAN